MFLKSINFIIQRSFGKSTTLRTIRTSTSFFSDEKAPPGQQTNPSPRRASFLDSIKKQREEKMSINNLPEKESIETLLKMQRVSHNVPKDFTTIYKFPAVKYIGLFNRLKVYQTAMTVLSSLGVSVLGICGFIPGSAVIATTGIGVSMCLVFYSIGYVASGFIGFMYYNSKTNMVRIAYVDFWGRRRDIEVPIKDIIPRVDCPETVINKVWFPLRRYSTNEVLKLQLDAGVILDSDALCKIL